MNEMKCELPPHDDNMELCGLGWRPKTDDNEHMLISSVLNSTSAPV